VIRQRNFFKTIIYQGSVATRFRSGDICHKTLLQIVCLKECTVKESVKSINIW